MNIRLINGQIIMGILLILTGLYSFTLSAMVGVFAVFFGGWTVFVGVMMKKKYNRQVNDKEDLK